jgi:hypothetical protein
MAMKHFQLPSLWQSKIFSCHKIIDQNSFLVTNRNEGSSSMTKDFLAFILIDVTNALGWTLA